jgi:2,4-dienoyl-CoA reductase-like NADH-dependent reductase (Old Yellow Enzyme family)
VIEEFSSLELSIALTHDPGLAMSAAPDAVVPAEEPAESPQKRRRLQYELLADASFHKSQLPTDDDWPTPDQDVVRQAARLWARQAKEEVGDFRSPRCLAGDRVQTVARCWKHEECEKWFRFTGKWTDEKSAFQVRIAQSGEHTSKPRKARVGKRIETEACQVTVEESRILAAADALAERNVAITPANVAVQMGRERVAGPALVNVIRNRKRKFGEQAEIFYCSAESFREYADEMLGCSCSG